MANSIAELKQAAIVRTLRGCQLFAGLETADLKSIAAITRVKPLNKGGCLFREGAPAQGFYIVQKGAINVHRVNAAGKEQVIRVFRDGESFAEAALATASGYPADARALESSQVLLVEKTGFLLSSSSGWAADAGSMTASALAHRATRRPDLKDVNRLANWLIDAAPTPNRLACRGGTEDHQAHARCRVGHRQRNPSPRSPSSASKSGRRDRPEPHRPVPAETAPTTAPQPGR